MRSLHMDINWIDLLVTLWAKRKITLKRDPRIPGTLLIFYKNPLWGGVELKITINVHLGKIVKTGED